MTEDDALSGVFEDWSDWVTMSSCIQKLESVGCGVETEPAGVIELLRVTRHGKSITVGPFINKSAFIRELFLEYDPNFIGPNRAARKYADTELALIKAICEQMQ